MIVNKVALGILAVIILTAMTVGGLVGLQLGGGSLGGDSSGEGAATPETTPAPAATPTATPTPTPTTSLTPTPTPRPTTSPTLTVTPTARPAATRTSVPTIAASQFEEAELECAVRNILNDVRGGQDVTVLRSYDPLDEMAAFHSGDMADQGFVSHAAAGFSTAERYSRYDLDSRCLVPREGGGVRDDQALEVIGKTVAGQVYTDDEGDRRINRDDRDIAERLLMDWFDDDVSTEKLLTPNAEEIGVGVIVQSDGDVYATVDLC